MSSAMERLLCIVLFAGANVYGASQKKGVSIPRESFRCQDFDALRGIPWWYDWSQTTDYANHCSNQKLAGHVPMVWGWRNGGDLPLNVPQSAHYVLGFNEPNFHGQANLSPEDAARHWRELQLHAGNKVLVSPAAAPCGDPNMCNGDAADWFDRFFRACSDCKVDYLATHGYWCDANIMMHYLQTLYDRFHKQIWVTEFSCPQRASVADQLNYMKAVLPRLEAANFVYRYAWFTSRFHGDGWVPSQASLLHQDSSTLTELGSFYMQF